MSRVFAGATPDGAVMLATLGLALIFFELNRPGRILPGAAGLLLTLLASSAVGRFGVRSWAVLLLVCCAATLLANLWRRLPLLCLVACTCVLGVGLRFLVASGSPAGSSRQVSTPVAVLCGGLLGTASATLTRVAYRARRSKALD